MKIRKAFIWIMVILAMSVAACTRPAPATVSPEPPVVNPTATILATEQETGPYPAPDTLTPPPTETPFPTEPPGDQTATPMPTQPQATQPASTAEPTATEVPATATAVPTNTPVASPTPTLPPYNAKASLGNPDFRDPMGASSDINWARDGELPDTDNLRLKLEDNQLIVIGRRPYFDTWWFSWPFLKDFFIQMDMETETCSGKDAYGLILRGPARDTGDTWGYIVTFSCDGHYRVRRVDAANPYAYVDLVPWTANVNIKTGSNQENRLGVELDGSTITIYANNFQIAELTDSEYSEGRFGIFVQSGPTVNFKYLVNEVAYWEFE